MSKISSFKKEKLIEIGEQAIDWALGKGIIFVKRKTEQEAVAIQQPIVTHIPLSILPSEFPKRLYEQAVSLSKDYNLLVHHLSKNFNFIQSTLKDVQDPFTQSLLKIHREIENEGKKQKIELGIFRSDYMVHHNDDSSKSELYQVELNTISSSFGCISAKVFDMHRYLIKDNHLQHTYPLENLPRNDSGANIARSIAQAHNLYTSSTNNTAKTNIVVMIVVQPDERNIWDQKAIEYTLSSDYSIKMIRRTLLELDTRGKIDPSNHSLQIDGYEISVSYYRAGYTPNDYPSENEWNGRLLVERSLAIKCPSIANHLVGAKKIQQAIAKKGVLEELLQDQESIKRMRRSFTGLYSLSKEDIDQEAVQKAKANPQLYVMKPQREGGGNNIYGDQVRESLASMNADELGSYILMDRIVPKAFNTTIIRESKVIDIEALYELGIFGLYIGHDDQGVLLNEEGGILLRTKTSNSDEGGVAAGFAVIDSLILTD
ncbi:glutathione synthase [Cavenderia fasciculata]|uniref:Glutathione synthetase n=1 Tax=Cavenderia fasciculata TaxID=261658 RepID=F4PUC5_CACFS|nr:glutathione synthase [Cavenderia fasciculata]EGG21840.1 glutathione synthase [Cavenderia fasciculata]|eukprot:XP_004359690.1 glutathione synthase [Cavenderia fasciculata]